MERLYCYRSMREVPLFDEDEWRDFAPAIHEAYAAFKRNDLGIERSRSFSAHFVRLVDPYVALTGELPVDPALLVHHRRSQYGPPCTVCGRPYRTPAATSCVDCPPDAEERERALDFAASRFVANVDERTERLVHTARLVEAAWSLRRSSHQPVEAAHRAVEQLAEAAPESFLLADRPRIFEPAARERVLAVLRRLRQALLMCAERDEAAMVEAAFTSGDEAFRRFATSTTLWAEAGSVVAEAGIAAGRRRRRAVVGAMTELGMVLREHCADDPRAIAAADLVGA